MLVQIRDALPNQGYTSRSEMHVQIRDARPNQGCSSKSGMLDKACRPPPQPPKKERPACPHPNEGIPASARSLAGAWSPFRIWQVVGLGDTGMNDLWCGLAATLIPSSHAACGILHHVTVAHHNSKSAKKITARLSQGRANKSTGRVLQLALSLR